MAKNRTIEHLNEDGSCEFTVLSPHIIQYSSRRMKTSNNVSDQNLSYSYFFLVTLYLSIYQF